MKGRVLRFTLVAGIAACALALALACAPPSASAQISLNPFQGIGTSVQSQALGWATTAGNWAKSLYTWLLIIEFIVLGITTLLFRDNLGEFFSGITLKIILGNVFMYFIVNGYNIGNSVIQSFTNAGQNLGGGIDPWVTIGGGLLAAVGLFIAPAVARGEDLALATVQGVMVLGSGVPGLGTVGALGHSTFEFMTDLLGLMMLLGFGGIALQLVLTTIESQIVLSAGILYLGFAASRFTMPFAQGYFNYMVSVGTKLFTLYLILGFVTPSLGVAAAAAVGAAYGGAALPDGIGSDVMVGVMAWAAIQILFVMALVWSVPQFAAGFMSGSSAVSANAVMGQVASSAAGLQNTMAAFASRSAAQGGAHEHDTALMAKELGTGADRGAFGGATNAANYAGQVPGAVGATGSTGTNGAVAGGQDAADSYRTPDTAKFGQGPRMGSNVMPPPSVTGGARSAD